MNMATITESLERSLQNCSLNHERRSSNSGGGGNLLITGSDRSLELNSHLSLPYHWEQCLDLKTGEIYYINWRNGMKAREDPRTAAQTSGGFYSEEEDEEEEDDEDDDDSSYDSEESPSESSPCSTRERANCNNNNSNHHRVEKDKDNVLVVAGCKSCLMYFMVPKQVEDCSKCNGQLLHFDRSESSSP
ncbi:uncharacterized protein LOC120188346 isoform X2 [Hibiscus syriacus]|uniref:uncharacterized protein LOC120188346 isoform X2 n=1 Tax=Hibiscus syriacus TaxID=106335 RepID=UPI00192435BB|nr:uncharacterized protein LOC120188346 isoform X2 [Hibiscus syriacus]